MTRPSWDDYFLTLCDVISTRATCDRLHVGSVIVRDNRIISSGYNGAPSGLTHCDSVGHEMVDGHCQRIVHSEVNAIVDAARRGVSVDEATLYCNYLPCYQCCKVIISAGISEGVYRDVYGSSKDKIVATFTLAGIDIRQVIK